MSVPTLIETAEKLLVSPLILNVEFLGTKVRAQLPSGYTLDIYYNATLQKYSYTIIKHDKRIIGWDNAPHHKHVKSYPHHFHTLDGKVVQSKMKGNPTEDVAAVLREAKKKLDL